MRRNDTHGVVSSPPLILLGVVLVLSILLLAVVVGVPSIKFPWESDTTPVFEVRITDKFGPWANVDVLFGEILIRHETQGWQEVDLMNDDDDREEVNLAAFNFTRDGSYYMLEQDDDLPMGTYVSIMIELEAARGVFDGNQTVVQFELEDLVLIINISFTLTPGTTTVLTIDFDLSLSITTPAPDTYGFSPEVTTIITKE
jgi:hypothetical protein